MKVPEEAVGKRVRCKACEQVFTIPDEDGPKATSKPVVAKPLPADMQKKPATAKPVAKPKEDVPPPQPASSPIGFADNDEDDGKDYGVTEDENDVPRCPRCAKDLDPPDTKVCLECGFDLVKRVRHSTKKVYATTGGDIFLYWLPAIIWIIVLLAGLGCVIWGWLMMTKIWTENEFLLADDKNPLTDKKQFLVDPNACNVCLSVFLLAMFGFGLPVIVKRIKQPKPLEVEKRK
jgi:ribosomal protein L37E